MENLKLWETWRAVPDDAQRPICGGRLSGKTDINPMWRMKTLSNTFGPVGFGWRYDITRQWIEEGANGEKCAFCNINMFVKHEGEWSEAIPGTGGSMLTAKESKGLYTSDECFKMALTDAISVSCKALGIGADIYWAKDANKYDKPAPPPAVVCPECGGKVKPAKKPDGTIAPPEKVLAGWGCCAECHIKKITGDAV